MTLSDDAAAMRAPHGGYGHVLFATRIGVCALVWQSDVVVAMQLPEGNGQATLDRMLGEWAQRRAAAGMPVAVSQVARSALQLPDVALQAVAGVQRLLDGWRAHTGAVLPAWDTAQVPPGATVLGDVRAQYRGPQAPPSAGADDGAVLPRLLELALDEGGVPDFARRVYALARQIPPGRTRTYGDLALELGGLGLARAVGQALGANPFAPVVPCHRVLAAGRQPGGFSGGQGAPTKLRMLELEGAAWGGSRSLFE